MLQSSELHLHGCSCCAGLRHRRHFLRMAGAVLASGLTFPFAAATAQPQYEVLLLTCNDPRIQTLTANYMKSRGMAGKYRQIALEGAAIGAVAEQFREARKTLWDDIAAFVDRYGIKTLIALDHRDCGAAKVAYGLVKATDKLIETESHHYALKEFRKQITKRYPQMEVEIGLMALDGKVQIFPPEKKVPPPETTPAPAPATPASPTLPAAPETVNPANTASPPAGKYTE